MSRVKLPAYAAETPDDPPQYHVVHNALGHPVRLLAADGRGDWRITPHPDQMTREQRAALRAWLDRLDGTA